MKRLNLLSIALLLAAMSFLLTTCGDDKKEKSSSSSSVESALVGYWFGSSVNTSEGLWMVLNLKSNGYADYRLFRSDVNDYHDISNFTSLPWRYNSSKNHIFLYISDTEGYSFPILSYSGNYMTVTRTLSGNVIQFNLERSSGSSSGGSSGGGSVQAVVARQENSVRTAKVMASVIFTPVIQAISTIVMVQENASTAVVTDIPMALE